MSLWKHFIVVFDQILLRLVPKGPVVNNLFVANM